MNTGDKVKVLETLKEGLRTTGVTKDDLFMIGNVYEVVHVWENGEIDINVPNYCCGYGLLIGEYELFGIKPYKEMK